MRNYGLELMMAEVEDHGPILIVCNDDAIPDRTLPPQLRGQWFRADVYRAALVKLGFERTEDGSYFSARAEFSHAEFKARFPLSTPKQVVLDDVLISPPPQSSRTIRDLRERKLRSAGWLVGLWRG